MKTLSIIIPAYNEAENIEQAVIVCEKLLPSLVEDYEIIVVNDGSSDATGEIIDQLAISHGKMRALHHEKNKGMGAAIALGITLAQYDFVCMIPADLQFDVADLGKFIPLIENADLVIGYRVHRDYNWYRWMITYTLLLIKGMYLF